MENKIIETGTNEVMTDLDLHEKQIINQMHIAVQTVFEIGKLLKAIRDGKEYTARGFKSFEDYMNNDTLKPFKFKYRQADKYISVFERYSSEQDKYQNVQLDVLYELRFLSNETLEQVDMDKMNVNEAKKLKDELKKANEQLTIMQSTVDEKAVELSSAKGRIENLEKEIDELQNRPVDVVVKKPDESVINELAEKKAAELTAADKAKIKELKKDIKELTKQAETAENEKSNYENKLKELDEHLNASKAEADEHIKKLEEQVKNAGQADAALIEYKFYFTEMQNNLKKFIGVLDKIDDADKKEKFKGAAVKFLSGILEEISK